MKLRKIKDLKRTGNTGPLSEKHIRIISFNSTRNWLVNPPMNNPEIRKKAMESRRNNKELMERISRETTLRNILNNPMNNPETRKKAVDKLKGRKNPLISLMKTGVKPNLTPERRKQLSEQLTGEKNPMKNSDIAKKVFEKTKGKLRSEQQIENMRKVAKWDESKFIKWKKGMPAWNKGKKMILNPLKQERANKKRREASLSNPNSKKNWFTTNTLITPELEQGIVDDYLNRMSITKITKKIGVSRRTIKNILIKKGVPIKEIRNCKETTEKGTPLIPEIIRLYNQELLGVKRISQRLNIGKDFVWKVLKKNNVPMREKNKIYNYDEYLKGKTKNKTKPSQSERSNRAVRMITNNPMKNPDIAKKSFERSRETYNKKNSQRDKIIIDLYQSGLGCRKISKETCCSEATVAYVLKKNNIQKRTQKDYTKSLCQNILDKNSNLEPVYESIPYENDSILASFQSLEGYTEPNPDTEIGLSVTAGKGMGTVQSKILDVIHKEGLPMVVLNDYQQEPFGSLNNQKEVQNEKNNISINA